MAQNQRGATARSVDQAGWGMAAGRSWVGVHGPRGGWSGKGRRGGGPPVPARCPTCQAVGRLIRWGFYARWLSLGPQEETRIRVQRVRCQECGHTHLLGATEFKQVLDETDLKRVLLDPIPFK